MRWTEDDLFDTQYSSYRVVKKFLFFPKTLDGQSRWLERASIQQKAYGILFPKLFGQRFILWSDHSWMLQ